METRHELINRIKQHPSFDMADLADLKELSVEDLRETLRTLNIGEAEERCIERLIEAGYDYKEITDSHRVPSVPNPLGPGGTSWGHQFNQGVSHERL